MEHKLDPADAQIAVRCQCGEWFITLNAWAEHIHNEALAAPDGKLAPKPQDGSGQDYERELAEATKWFMSRHAADKQYRPTIKQTAQLLVDFARQRDQSHSRPELLADWQSERARADSAEAQLTERAESAERLLRELAEKAHEISDTVACYAAEAGEDWRCGAGTEIMDALQALRSVLEQVRKVLK